MDGWTIVASVYSHFSYLDECGALLAQLVGFLTSRRTHLTVLDAMQHPLQHFGFNPAHRATAGAVEANPFGKGCVVLLMSRATLGIDGGTAQSCQFEQLGEAQDARRQGGIGCHVDPCEEKVPS